MADIKCGQWVSSGYRGGDCGKPATGIALGILAPRWGRKTVRMNELTEQDIKRYIYCNFHRGVEKRKKYSPMSDADFMAVDDERAQPFLARLARLVAERRAEQAKANKAAAAEALLRQKRNNEKAWKDYYAEPTLEVTEEHEITEEQIREQTGYRCLYHELEFFGLCPDCAAGGAEG